MNTTLVDDITTAFLAALAAGGQHLGIYSLAILSFCATIAYYKEYAMVTMYGTGLGDALAGLLVFALGAMGYLYLMKNLVPIANAALGTAMQWGLLGTGGTTLSVELLTKPSFIMEAGLKAAFPLADQAAWYQRVWTTLKSFVNPFEAAAYWLCRLCLLRHYGTSHDDAH